MWMTKYLRAVIYHITIVSTNVYNNTSKIFVARVGFDNNITTSVRKPQIFINFHFHDAWENSFQKRNIFS